MAITMNTLLLKQSDLAPAKEAALEASPETLGKLYTIHYRHVLLVCRRFFKRPEDAEDAAAEVFLKLRTVLKQKDESRPFRPWVAQVAGRYCIDKLRKMRLEKAASVEGIEVTDLADRTTQSPLSQVLENEEQRWVNNVLSKLPEHHRIPLILRYYKDMSYSEIGRKLNRGLPAVRCMIFRAKNQMRRNLLLTAS
jgi:RNA polymerase sigma-70 factor (ECF subfamily)